MTVNFGILGAGEVSRHFVSSLSMLSDVKVQAVASRTRARAEDFAADFGVPHHGDDYEALLSRPDVDVVYIATPTSLHAEHSLMAIRAGKAVLCEKPFATTASEAGRVIEAARTEGVFCMEGMWMRFIPLVQALKKHVENETIGPIHQLNAELHFPVAFDAKRRHYDPALGGGALLDLGVYPISLATFLLGQPTAVTSSLLHAPTGVDAQSTVLLRYPNAIATLSCGFNGTGRNDAQLIGTRGRFDVAPPIYAPTTMTMTKEKTDRSDSASHTDRSRSKRSPTLVELRRRITPWVKPLIRGNRSRHAFHFRGYGYQFEALEVVRCIQNGLAESPVMPLDETLANMRLVDKARDPDG